MRIEWDSAKAEANLAKHGVSFEQALELLASDVECLEIYDVEHSGDEDRFITVGATPADVLVVVWTEPEEGTIRIISARGATKREIRLFHAYMEGAN